MTRATVGEQVDTLEERIKNLENNMITKNEFKLIEQNRKLLETISDLKIENISLNNKLDYLHKENLNLQAIIDTGRSNVNRIDNIPISKSNPRMTTSRPSYSKSATNGTKMTTNVSGLDNRETKGEIDLQLITSSHGKNIIPEKMYKNKKVDVKVLPDGKKNLEGALEAASAIKPDKPAKNYLYIVAGNDADKQGSDPKKIVDDFKNVITIHQKNTPESGLFIMPLLYRVGKTEYNSKADLINLELLNYVTSLKKENIVIINEGKALPMKNEYYVDNVHLSELGMKELIKCIKGTINVHLGLKKYEEYKIKDHGPRYQRSSFLPQHVRQRMAMELLFPRYPPSRPPYRRW